MSKSDVLDQFMEALKTWYSWIERDLRKNYTNYEEEQTWNEAIASIKAIPRQNVSRNALVSCLNCRKIWAHSLRIVKQSAQDCGQMVRQGRAYHKPGKVSGLCCWTLMTMVPLRVLVLK